MSNRFPISQEGLNKLELELKNLKNIERPEVIKEIVKARAHGDLSENAEYHAAREKQGFIEAKISELEDKIARAEIIDISNIQGDKIKYGATVKLRDEETGVEIVYKIVGDYKADASHGSISISSPLSKTLLGKKKGALLEFKTPRCVKYYEILSITYS